MKKILLLILLTITLCGCTYQNKEISYKEANNLIQDGAILIDVRTTPEYEAKHIENAISIPLNKVEKTITKEITSKKTPIIVYCQSGTRSKEAYEILKKLGYTQVYNLGSIDKWE